MKINESSNLNECLILLNWMLESIEDYSCSGSEVECIIVSPDRMHYLKQLLPEIDDLKEYLEYYGEYWETEGFDITGIWMEVSYKFRKDIWVDIKKKRFYIRRWYHRLFAWPKKKRI